MDASLLSQLVIYSPLVSRCLYSPSIGMPELVVVPKISLGEVWGRDEAWARVGGRFCTKGEGKGKKGGEACILEHGKDS